MDKAFLYQLADKAKTKAGQYIAALDSYQDELKKSGRDTTKEDADNIQRMKQKASEILNAHAEIYREIYAVE